MTLIAASPSSAPLFEAVKSPASVLTEIKGEPTGIWYNFFGIEEEESMLFVTIGKAKAASTTKQRVARRVNWKYPAGLKVVGEYWLQSNDPTLIAILETQDVGALMSAVADWDDAFDLTVLPAMTADQGLQLAKQMAA